MTRLERIATHWRRHVKPAAEQLSATTSTLSTGVVLSNGKPVGTCVIAMNKAGVKTVHVHIGGVS